MLLFFLFLPVPAIWCPYISFSVVFLWNGSSVSWISWQWSLRCTHTQNSWKKLHSSWVSSMESLLSADSFPLSLQLSTFHMLIPIKNNLLWFMCNWSNARKRCHISHSIYSYTRSLFFLRKNQNCASKSSLIWL